MDQQKKKEKDKSWKRMCFKHNKVWVALGRDDRPSVEKGKVLIKYQLDQPHEYWVRLESIRPLPQKGGCRPDTAAGKAAPGKTSATSHSDPGKRTAATAQEANIIHVYTDGASSGNPGPAGIGIFLRYGLHEKKISQYIGIATNNIAELEAIRVGLAEIKNPELPVRIYTDSNYALGLLTLEWKPKKNKELVASIKKLMHTFNDLQFVKVRGHAGDEGNEVADRLATGAIKEHA